MDIHFTPRTRHVASKRVIYMLLYVISIQNTLTILHKSETFLLRFKFDASYPMEAPEVTFVVSDGWQAPERELPQFGNISLETCQLRGLAE